MTHTKQVIDAFKLAGKRCDCKSSRIDHETGEELTKGCDNCTVQEAMDELGRFNEVIEFELVFASDISEAIEPDWRNWLQDDHFPLHEDDDHCELFDKFCDQWQAFFLEESKVVA